MVEGGITINPDIQQHFYCFREKADRVPKLCALLQDLDPKPGSTVIFAATKTQAQILFDVLDKRGILCVVLHGGMKQSERIASVDQFINLEVNVSHGRSGLGC